MKTDLYLVAPQWTDDIATDITNQWAVELQPYLAGLPNCQVSFFAGTNPVCNDVRTALQDRLDSAEERGEKPAPAVFIFLGHGGRDQLSGIRSGLRVVDHKDGDLLENIFVFAVACRSAVTFGHQVVQEGASGFIGFNHNVILSESAKKTLNQCMIQKPLEHLLTSRLSASKVRDLIQHKLTGYRKKCARAIHNHTSDAAAATILDRLLEHNHDFVVHVGNTVH